MRSYLFSLILIFTGLSSFAQSGWRWTRFDRSEGMFNQTEPLYMTTDSKGSAIVTGYYYGDTLWMGNVRMPNPRYHTTYLQLFIMKHDSVGNALWAIGSTGDGTEAMPNQIAADADGNTIVFGHYDGSLFKIHDSVLHNTTTHTDMGFVLKVSPTGVVKWARNVDLGIMNFNNNTVGMGVDRVGDIYITGHYKADSVQIGSTVLHNSNAPTTETFLAKFSSNGNVLWAKNIGNNDYNEPMGLAVTPRGNCYLVMNNTSADTSAPDTLTIGSMVVPGATRMLLRFDKWGFALEGKAINLQANMQPKSMAVDPDGGVYIAGIGQKLASGTYWNLGVLNKFNAHLDSSWTQWLSSTCYSVSNDTCGNVWVAGSMSQMFGNFQHIMYFPGDTLRTTGATYDPSFIAHYDTAGNYISSMAVATGGDDECAISVDNNGCFYFMGDVIETSGPICNGYFLYPGTGEYMFLGRYKYLNEMCRGPLIDTSHFTTGVENIADAGINIYPNPATSQFSITSVQPFVAGASLVIYDMAGRMLARYPLSGNSATIPIGRLATGLHQVVIYNGSDVPTVRKLSIIN